jgi:hypothetical protein
MSSSASGVRRSSPAGGAAFGVACFFGRVVPCSASTGLWWRGALMRSRRWRGQSTSAWGGRRRVVVVAAVDLTPDCAARLGVEGRSLEGYTTRLFGNGRAPRDGPLIAMRLR